MSKDQPKGVLYTVAVLFFLSGISGLIYQVLWLRLLSLVFGVTVYAASAVLASFMGGLALGSSIGGRFADRAGNPLLLYAVIEVLIGLSALLSSSMLDVVESLYSAMYSSLPGALAVLTLVRFVLASLVLLIPTTMMGMTLPMVVKSSVVREHHIGERVAFLYAANTAGALTGTILAGFFLIGNLGIKASFGLAAGLNILAGAAAALVWLGFARNQAPLHGIDAVSDSPRKAIDPGQITSAPRIRALILILFTLSGFVTLALEVVWFRVLIILYDVTTYAFTIMLAAVLFGIALGSFIITPLMRHIRDYLAGLALIELAIGIFTMLSLLAMSMPFQSHYWSDASQRGLFMSHLAVVILPSFLALVPVTLLMGLAFPIGVKLWTTGTELAKGAGHRIGIFYAFNVLGAILGSLIAAFVLLPKLGSGRSVFVLAAISLVSGLLLLGALPRTRRTFALATGLASVTLFLFAAKVAPDALAVALSQRYSDQQIVWLSEGEQTAVSVHEEPDGAIAMYINGSGQAYDRPGIVRRCRRIGLLPLLLHPDPKQALVIGLGGGITAGAVSRFRDAEVQIVELSKGVIEASDWFIHVNYDVNRQPNVRLQLDDGRNYLLLTDKRYDAIAADIIVPEHAGSGNLYAIEYFQLAKRALNEDGLMVQWIPPRSEEEYKLILRTFASVFPDVTLCFEGRLAIGSKHPLRISQAAFERAMRDPVIRDAVASIRVYDFKSLLDFYTAGPDEIRAYVGTGPLLTDDRPMLEYFLSRTDDGQRANLDGVHGDVMRHVIQ